MGSLENISGHTKTIGLVGTPVEHSLSPAMHIASFEHLGLDYLYLAYEVAREEDLEAAVRGMKALGFAGYQVTMPYKTKVLPYLDELTPAAELMGAVNTVSFENSKAIGHNTDGAGFMRGVADAGVEIVGKKITLVGAGGAGSAISTQAALDGVAAIDLFNVRDAFFEHTAERIERLAERTGCAIRLIDLADTKALRESVATSVLFTNTTRVGMEGMAGQSVLPPEFMHAGLAVGDTVYNPRKTQLTLDAEARGLTTVPGLSMLLRQACISEEIRTGASMPTELIKERFFD